MCAGGICYVFRFVVGCQPGAAGEWLLAATGLLIIVVAALFILSFATWLTMRYVPNDYAAIVEKLWSSSGSVPEGRDHRAQRRGRLSGRAAARWHASSGSGAGSIAFTKCASSPFRRARSATCMPAMASRCLPGQTLGRVAPCNNFQDARRFLNGDGTPNAVRGQRGRQRAILREGVYAINLALFVVITENKVHVAAARAGSARSGQHCSVARRAARNRRVQPDRDRCARCSVQDSTD